jgi:hypothetical protein
MDEAPDRSIGTLYRNIHRKRNDVYVVVGKSFGKSSIFTGTQEEVPITLVMWADGTLGWIMTSLIGDHNDRKL